jgi:hypothetical protein
MGNQTVLTPTPDEQPEVFQPRYLFRIRKMNLDATWEYVYVYGASVQISGTGDIAVMTWDNRRVFGLKADQWREWCIVDPETREPYEQDFPDGC